MSTLATLVVKLTADTGEFVERMEGAQSRTARFAAGVGRNMQALGKVALGGVGPVAAAAGGAAVAIGKLAADAAPLETISAAFDGIAESAGTSSDAMLRALREGSSGMIANRDLMTSFNKAAQLVSTDFARTLPDAMGYLGKVAAATGQDMGFLLDSLVTGVGRLSPMILDNLAIQVNLTEAYETWAAANGVAVEEMTKAQQQAALMGQVMQKLAENTAAMPEVSGSAAASIAQMQATFQNAKDEVGQAFLPVLTRVLEVVAGLAEQYLPLLVSAAGQAGAFIAGLVPTFQQVWAAIGQARAAVEQLVAKIWPVIEPVVQWIGENVKLQDVLIALGIAIAAVVLPALWSIITAAAPVIAVGIALIAGVAALRAAWENDFGGIRTFLTQAFEAIRAAFEFVLAQLTSLYQAFAAAFSGDWYTFGEKLREVWDRVWGLIKGIGTAAWEAIKRFFTETDWGAVGRSILQGIANGIKNGIKIIKDAAWNAAKAALEAAKGFLGIRSPSRAFLEQVARPSMQGWARGLEQTRPLELAAARAARVSLEAAQPVTVREGEYHLHIHSDAPRENLVADFAMLRAMAGA